MVQNEEDGRKLIVHWNVHWNESYGIFRYVYKEDCQKSTIGYVHYVENIWNKFQNIRSLIASLDLEEKAMRQKKDCSGEILIYLCVCDVAKK